MSRNVINTNRISKGSRIRLSPTAGVKQIYFDKSQLNYKNHSNTDNRLTINPLMNNSIMTVREASNEQYNCPQQETNCHDFIHKINDNEVQYNNSINHDEIEAVNINN